MKHWCLALRGLPDPPCWADWSVWQTPAGSVKGLRPEGGKEGQSLWALCRLQSPLTSQPLLELDSTSAIMGSANLDMDRELVVCQEKPPAHITAGWGEDQPISDTCPVLMPGQLEAPHFSLSGKGR